MNAEYEEEHKQWQLGRKYIEELYQLRNAIIHGNDQSKRTWGWSNFEHLIIGAYVYPLVVKLLLEKSGYYTLSDSDKIACRSIDIILAKKNWHERPTETDNHTNWQEAISEARQKHTTDMIVEYMKEIELSDDVGGSSGG